MKYTTDSIVAVSPPADNAFNENIIWKKICDEPTIIPELSFDEILQYFDNVYLNDIDGLEKQDWKNLNSGGFKLFKEGHVQDISAVVVNNICQVKGKCLPEMKKDRVYSLELYINVNNSIITGAKCTCPAGCGPRGSCKHIAVISFALEDFVRIRRTISNLQDTDEEISCTSLLQQWNKPRKRRLDSKMVEDIGFQNRNPLELYDPRPAFLRKTTKGDLEEFQDALSLLPATCGFVHLLNKPSDIDSESGKAILPLIPRSVKAKISNCILKTNLPPSLETIKEFGEKFIVDITPTNDQQQMIEKKTRLQADCTRWHEERYCRLTASNFGQVLQRRSDFKKLASDLLSVKPILNVPAVQWGREHESDAFQAYAIDASLMPQNYLLRCLLTHQLNS